MNVNYIFFSNLANPLKMKIVVSLSERDMSVKDLGEKLKVEQSKLSHALKSLRICSIVTNKRYGKRIVYSLNKETISPILKLIEKHEKKYCKKCLRK